MATTINIAVPSAKRRLEIRSVYHNDVKHPKFEGCVKRADPLTTIPWSVNGYYQGLLEALADGLFLDPGTYFLYEAEPFGGLIFTMTDDGQVVQGMRDTNTMPRLTSWPPRKR